MLRFTVSFVVAAFAVTGCNVARAQSALIPAYGNPCCDGGSAMWSTLIASARSGSPRIHVILEPASGPGASPIDPNYVSEGAVGPAVDLTKAGGKLYGYVPTSYGARPLSAVIADIDTYYDPAYWRGAGVLVRGIFVDEMSNDLALTAYYKAVAAYVKAKDGAAWLFGNPGTTFTVDSSAGASGFTVDDYARSVDTLVTFENSGANYRAAYTAPGWLDRLDAQHFAHIVHSELVGSDMLADVRLASSRKAGFVYVTDDVLPNPYDALASYWPAEQDALVSRAVPANGTRAQIVLALLLLAAGWGRRQQQHALSAR